MCKKTRNVAAILLDFLGVRRLLPVDLLKLIEDRLGEGEGGGLAAHIAGERLAVIGEDPVST